MLWLLSSLWASEQLPLCPLSARTVVSGYYVDRNEIDYDNGERLMATTATRTSTVTYSGDVSATETAYATDNAASPAQFTIQNLASGANTITVPVGGGAVSVAVTITPPAGNTTTIILKGVTGDTGVGLHLTDPSVIALASTVATFVLTTGGIITGVRLQWN